MTNTMPIGVDRARDGADRVRQQLASGELRRLLERFVRRRVRPADVDDVVQTVLCDALAAERAPDADGELRRWVMGIARHKVADLHRRGGRERVGPTPELSEPAPPVEQRAMVDWAEQQAPQTADDQRTLDWLAREGEGEKLAAIADDAKLPAAQVRQRVSRLRRLLRDRWVRELAAVAAVAVFALVVWRLTQDTDPGRDAIVPEPPSALVPREPTPVDRAATLRTEAAEQCDDERWQRCLELLDEAARLDPAGEQLPAARGLRERVKQATELAPESTPEESKFQQPNESPPTAPTSRPPVKAPAPTSTEPTRTPTSTAPTPSQTAPNPPQQPAPTQQQGPSESVEPAQSAVPTAPRTTATATSAPPQVKKPSYSKGKGGSGDWSSGAGSSLK